MQSSVCNYRAPPQLKAGYDRDIWNYKRTLSPVPHNAQDSSCLGRQLSPGQPQCLPVC